MSFLPEAETPSVVTSDVTTEAEAIFTTLQNKEKLVSFLDCTTLLRGMGMNPTRSDMDRLKAAMTQPILRLEQWRREEELKRDQERRKEEARERKASTRASIAPSKKSTAAMEAAAAAATSAEAVDITPAEEVKNIDWNIFTSCIKTVFRDRLREEGAVADALRVFTTDTADTMTRDRLIEIVTAGGDNVLTPTEVQALVAMLPEECSVAELAARIQGTYDPQAAAAAEDDAAWPDSDEAVSQRSVEPSQADHDPLAGL